MSKVLPIFQIMAKNQAFPFFSYLIFPTIKNSSQNVSIKLSKNSILTSRTLRQLLEQKPCMINFGRTVPSDKYCCKYSGYWRHFIPMTIPVPCSPASCTFLSLCFPTPALYCVSPIIM